GRDYRRRASRSAARSERHEVADWTPSPTGARLNAMLAPGEFRRQISVELNAAYGEGLLSEQTHAHRIDQVQTSRLLDPERLIGDLSLRASRRSLATPGGPGGGGRA